MNISLKGLLMVENVQNQYLSKDKQKYVKEEKVLRELAKAKIQANRVASAVANEGKLEIDEVMHVITCVAILAKVESFYALNQQYKMALNSTSGRADAKNLHRSSCPGTNFSLRENVIRKNFCLSNSKPFYQVEKENAADVPLMDKQMLLR
ncbi:hypothetical protein HPP92_020035 [Vanilla planifolia]|uniref:Uncharacterized protein n=1 Tax=Vanilla planifolia TaxID=51239 RepID=A0A835Q805_VANPL|nr:hypothetical protein HPP92_020035 [Vanilla planifolia]